MAGSQELPPRQARARFCSSARPSCRLGSTRWRPSSSTAWAIAPARASSTLEVPRAAEDETRVSSVVVVRTSEQVPPDDAGSGNPLYVGDRLLYPNAGEALSRAGDRELTFYYTVYPRSRGAGAERDHRAAAQRPDARASAGHARAGRTRTAGSSRSAGCRSAARRRHLRASRHRSRTARRRSSRSRPSSRSRA